MNKRNSPLGQAQYNNAGRGPIYGTPSVAPNNVPWNQPQGADTVPAMLTPGEFVMNNKAVDMYGPQIKAMNDQGRKAHYAETGGGVPMMPEDREVPQMNQSHAPIQKVVKQDRHGNRTEITYDTKAGPMASFDQNLSDFIPAPPPMNPEVPMMNAGGRAEATHTSNARQYVDWMNKGDYSHTPWFKPYPGPDPAPQYKPNKPVIKPSGNAGPPYYNEGGVAPQYYGIGDFVSNLFSGEDPNAGYANYNQQQFVDEANNPSRNVAPSAGQYAPSQPQVPEIPGDRMVLSGGYNDRIARETGQNIQNVDNQLGLQQNTGALLGGNASDGLPALDLTPPPMGSDQDLLQNSSGSVKQTEQGLVDIIATDGSTTQPIPQQDQGVPPIHQMPDGTMMPGASHQGGQPQQQSSVYDRIAQHEGFRDEAYDDGTGVWTIGFGRITNPDGSRVQPGQTTNRESEQQFLKTRVDEDKQHVLDYARKHGYNWRPDQVDALTSFTYNIGKGGLDKLTAGGSRSDDEILGKLPEYNKAGGKFMQGLQNRRNDEAALFGGYDQAGLDYVAPSYEPDPQVEAQRAALQQRVDSGNSFQRAIRQGQLNEFNAANPPGGIAVPTIPEDNRWFGGLRDKYNTYQNNVGPTYDEIPELGAGIPQPTDNVPDPTIHADSGIPYADMDDDQLSMVSGGFGIEAKYAADEIARRSNQELIDAQSELQAKVDAGGELTDDDVNNINALESKVSDSESLVSATDAQLGYVEDTRQQIEEANIVSDERVNAARDARYAQTGIEPKSTEDQSGTESSDSKVDKTAEDFREAESRLANATGGFTGESDITDEQLSGMQSNTEAAIEKYNTDNASSGKDVVDTLPAEEKNRVKSILKDSFGKALKNIVGADTGTALAEALIMYAGGRLTGMSNGQALNFAGKTILQKGAAYQAEQKSNKATSNAIAEKLVDWEKVDAGMLEDFKKHGDFTKLPQITDESRRKAIVQASLTKKVDASQWTKAQQDNYIATGEIPKIDQQPLISKGAQDQSDSLFVAGQQIIPYKNASNSKDNARYVDYDLDGDGTSETYTVPQFQNKLRSMGIESTGYIPGQHSYDATKKSFTDFVSGEVELLNHGKKEFDTFAVNNVDLGTVLTDTYTTLRASNPRTSDKLLKEQVREGTKKYLKDIEKFQNGQLDYNPAGSLESYVERRLFVKLYAPVQFEKLIDGSDAKVTQTTLEQLKANVDDAEGNEVSQSDPRFDKIFSEDLKENVKGWEWMKSKGRADRWIKAAEGTNVTPYMLWLSSFSSPGETSGNKADATTDWMAYTSRNVNK